MNTGTREIGAVMGTSLWRATNASIPPTSLEGRIATDVLIVGAGLAGLSLGVHLAERRMDTVILEAGFESDGATGASAGIVAPQLVRTTPGRVLKRLGRESGSRLLRLIAESGRYTFDLIKHKGIDCNAQQSGFLAPATTASGAGRQARTVDEWRAFRKDLQIVGGEEVRRLSGCHGYSSAIMDPSGGRLDPVAFSRGLARALQTGGGQLYGNSRVLSLTRAADHWLARTASGEVEARRVILCANGGNTTLHPRLAETVLPLPVCEVATRPLATSLRTTILPYGHALTDTSSDVFSIRLDAAGRLITSCPVDLSAGYDAISQRVNQRLASRMEGYSSTPLEYIWQGTAWLNGSFLPRVLRVDTDMMAVQACNGRGIGVNTLIGRELARWLVNDHDPPLVPIESPARVRGFMLAKYLPKLMIGGAALAKRTMQRLGRRG